MNSFDDQMLLSIPKLMILGILYTSSNANDRSEKLYDLVQLEMEPIIDTSDKEFKDCFALIAFYCYIQMPKHYNQYIDSLNKNGENKKNWQAIPQTVIDFDDQA